MQQVDEFVKTVQSKSDVLLKQKDDLDDRIRKFLGIIDRASNEINDLEIKSDCSEDLTVGDFMQGKISEMVYSVKISPNHPRQHDTSNESPEIPELNNTKVCPGCSHVHSNRGKYCSAQCANKEQNRRYRDKLKLKQENKKKDNQEKTISNLREKITSVETMEKSMKKTSKTIQQRLVKKQQRGSMHLETFSVMPGIQGPIDPDLPFTPDPEPSYDFQD